jgi:hypothetical protein
MPSWLRCTESPEAAGEPTSLGPGDGLLLAHLGRVKGRHPTNVEPEHIMARATVFAAPTLAAVALAASGCGDSPSAAEAWATSVCTPALAWRNELTSISADIDDELKSPSLDTAPALRTSLAQAGTATQALIDDLSEVGAPPGPNGAKASDIVAGLASSLRLTLSTVRTQVESLGRSSSLEELTNALSVIGPQLAGAVAQVQSALDTVASFGGDLKDGIESADSCQDLRNS